MIARFIFPLILLLNFASCRGRYGQDNWKTGCTYTGQSSFMKCDIIGFKNFWRHNSIAWFPEQTRNMSYTELKKHCDDSFVCLENTGCYKDFVNYQELDKCIDDVFWLGPMGFCEMSRSIVSPDCCQCTKNTKTCVSTIVHVMDV
ncbi:hypothetical protein B9Z55_020687 [Caenorhabditis nigoni]|uniref:DUF19 domain-containing protein n=1 Tax=Caenorhabditis nigoni TaxID=1611254 RepID=A0A2G5TNV9_9PELO|nr:hypothetical protein B9Z55_020687 [Caenorhabditis nigoni]